jgi:hypothetical protein
LNSDKVIAHAETVTTLVALGRYRYAGSLPFRAMTFIKNIATALLVFLNFPQIPGPPSDFTRQLVAAAAVWQLKDGEDKTIAERLVEIFSVAPRA